ncbi:MAG: formylglycine-generating enzyme family protein [Thermodesulfobacteriota bacterium]
MKNLKLKNISGSLIPLFLIALITGPATSFAAGTNRAPGEGQSGFADKSNAPLPAAPGEIEQVFIPGGKVTLGSDSREKTYAYSIGGEGARKWRWFDGEKKRTLFVGDFYIDKYPVTDAQYFLFVQATGHRAPFISKEDYQKQGFLVHPYSTVRPYLWHKENKEKNTDRGKKAHNWARPPADKLDNPVVLVSVGDARSYCRWRGGFNPEKTFSLPSEDQWEKAARGTDARYFPWGNSWDKTRANIGSTGPGGTTPVDRYPEGKSPYGVFDMAGNIFEWTDTPAAAGSTRFILKSCSWDDMPGICRGAARHSRLKTSRHILIGFRCVSTNK